MEVCRVLRARKAGLRTVQLVFAYAVLEQLSAVPALHAAPSASETETARSLMEQGDKLNAAGDLRTALSRYQWAHALMHVPTTGIQVARVQAKLGLLVEARATAMEVVNLAAVTGEPRVFTDARRDAATLARELEPRVPQLTTIVTPGDAVYRVTVDGAPLPTEARAAPYRTNPGVHVVRVEAAGFMTETIQVDLAERQSRSIALTLKPLTKADTAPAPVPAAPAPAPATQAVAAPAQTAPVLRDVEATSDPAAPGRLRAMIGFSVGGAAVIIGTVAGIASASKVSDTKKDCPDNVCTSSRRAALSSANTLANVANVAIPLGVVGLAYGLYEILTLPASDRSAARDRGVHVTLTNTGVVVGGVL